MSAYTEMKVNTHGYLGHPGSAAAARAALLKFGWTTGTDVSNGAIEGECYINPAVPERDIVLFDNGGAFSMGPRNSHWYRTVASSRMLPGLLEQLHEARPSVSGEALLAKLTEALMEASRA